MRPGEQRSEGRGDLSSCATDDLATRTALVVFAVHREEQVVGVCTEGSANGIAASFCSLRGSLAELWRSEAEAKLTVLMDCAQRGQALPGFAEFDGPHAPPAWEGPHY
jgi:hypothetical protein